MGVDRGSLRILVGRCAKLAYTLRVGCAKRSEVMPGYTAGRRDPGHLRVKARCRCAR